MNRKGYEYPTLEQLWFLEPVPCVEPAYGLRYDPAELERDEVMSWYRMLPHPMTGQPMIRKLKVTEKDANHCMRKNGRSPNAKQQLRLKVQFKYQGKTKDLWCAHLTLYCKTGYKPEDRRHNVAMHLNDVSTDDRPCNLRWGTQRENIFMSAKAVAAMLRNLKKGRERKKSIDNSQLKIKN